MTFLLYWNWTHDYKYGITKCERKGNAVPRFLQIMGNTFKEYRYELAHKCI